MQNIVLVIHLLLALLLIGAVLLQRSEGGALGMGGGGNVMSGRGAATALQKATWGLAAAFIITSLTLTFFAFQQAQDEGLGLGQQEQGQQDPASGAQPAGDGGGLPPALGDDLLDLAPAGAPAEAPAEQPEAGGPDLPPPLDLPSQ